MESCETLKEENREATENCNASTLRVRSWEQKSPALLPLPAAVQSAHQSLSLPVSAVLKPHTSSRPSCLQATVPRVNANACLMRHAQGDPGLDSEGWLHCRWWPHTILSAGWALVTQQAPVGEVWAMDMLYLQPVCPPRQHPRGAGPPIWCCHTCQRAPGSGQLPHSPYQCCPSWGIPGLTPAEAKGFWCILPTTGFSQIARYFFSLLLLLQVIVPSQ